MSTEGKNTPAVPAKGKRRTLFQSGNPDVAIVCSYFSKKYPEIAKKIQLQVRRSPRRQTGIYKTNRESRWKLAPDHPDYTALEDIPGVEAKLFSQILQFEGAPIPTPEVVEAATRILGKECKPNAYRCPISGRPLSFNELLKGAQNPSHGRSDFHVGHIRPKALGGSNTADNTYWTSSLGNRIQGDKSWAETVKTIIEMAEFQRKREGVSWLEMVNRYLV